MNDFKRTCRIGRKDFGFGESPRLRSVFVTIKYDNGRLSITGVEGPKANGDCVGGCGQINLNAGEWLDYAPGWDADRVAKLSTIWGDWHLNDMQAGNPQQTAWLKANPVNFTFPDTHYEAATRALDAAGLNGDGDKYGHKWHRVEVPGEVLEWINALPEADTPSPWKD